MFCLKKEYKEELEKILQLLDSEDDETIILGLNMFKTSKWITDITKQPNFDYLHIANVEKDDNYSNWEDLSFCLDNILGGNIIQYFGDRANIAYEVINSLLTNNLKIVSIVPLDDF